ncbi:hypothetical protein MSMEI_1788 [Mycolicibacterium smegmatis MC2 155]|uniref:Uncharacterized protein n=1 Tax=Mycolicibacterium smegmatis (strain ATCC 700084 / mc(2)155) TaxID=246196 RepID=I7F9L1_MYCS2|nr:hypothetical protein MSMEI_1788 [Mycolicibacterium smegmatis MC2 155]
MEPHYCDMRPSFEQLIESRSATPESVTNRKMTLL